ncbi:hypothetical protein G6F46_000142 [Rhizopus delemar]|uniref:Coth protein-domain-containing protein n=2 Tax=Rhizopus TaxID=4842 RepID=A0A9P7CUS4_9FUNG|nr:hypothetical protein G6F55_000460 [Rhizopus delemar]KAG1554059.1 hypothetical protein G6F51_000206 [Rhizopus arrhizus]KAG1501493.1 hypothetical protein G6F54_003009 [Rhizopus delemar]KAG1515054.1 hypothetical protein G6F53_003216 [Rhizopus delemar]KAG1528010.1 hypothetical protein G6F52_001034 [Rhizopus delemar]
MKSLSFISLACLTAVHAASVTFKVIAPTAESSVQVNINGQLTQLKAQDEDIPYYTGSAELNDGQSYKYVVDGAAETFERILNGTSTKNEFFNRPITYATNIPELPNILSEGSWTRGETTDPLWDSNYVPSIFVTGKSDEMEDLITNVTKKTYQAKITFIGPENITTIENCTFGLHKPGRKHNDAKQTWVWTLPEGQYVAKRSWFKIRHMEEDPTQLREKLYADIARKMGTYANEANMVRFFINKEGMGTFNMLDDVIMYSYINAMFYNGNPPQQLGALYDGASGAAFNASGDMDSFIPNVESPLDQDALMPFSKAFAAVDFSNDDQVKAISQYFDYDQFLRFMVMEFLTADWDGYWQEQTNDGAYIDVSDNNKVYYLAQDFDATFGVNLDQERDFVNTPYTDFPTKFPGGILINKLLENPTTKATFETYLKTTVQEIFNNATLGAYVTARHNFLAPDLKWDRSIKQRSPGNIFGWTYEQTYQNLFEGVTAPGKEQGGAEWGLLEWVAAKEKAVRSSLKLSETATTSTSATIAAPATSESASQDNTSDDTDSASTSSSTLNQAAADTSSASKSAPHVLLLAAGALFISFF